MSSALEKHLQILPKFQDVSILVFGDIMLDHYVWGQAQRLSDEAPVPVVWVGKEEDRLGGAANDVRNLRGLGVKVSLVGVVGNDPEAARIEALIEQSGVQELLLIREDQRPTTLKTRVIARNQQVVRIDRETLDQISPTSQQQIVAFIEARLESYDAIILSEYGKGFFTAELAQKLKDWQLAGRIGLKNRPLILDPHPRNSELYRYASVVKPNRAEAEKAIGKKINSVQDAFLGATQLQKMWGAELVLLSLSEDGMVIVGDSLREPIHIKTRAVEVADVSGAGDTVTSVFAAALAAGADVQLAGELANLAAGIVISEVGTAAISSDKLKSALIRAQNA